MTYLYNIFLHPLSQYPGPPLAAATRLWYCYYAVRGKLAPCVHAAHQKYGEVVRIAPDELSYIDPRAFNDIYGHRIGKPELTKDPRFYQALSSGEGSIIKADRQRHGHLRKQASHGFSERAMKSRQHVIVDYADLMLDRLEECAATGKPVVNIVDWFNVSGAEILNVAHV